MTKNVCLFFLFLLISLNFSRLNSTSQEALGSLGLEETAAIQDNYKSASFKKIHLQSKSFESIIIINISVCKIIVYYVWIVVWWKWWQKYHCLPNIEPANQGTLHQDTSAGLVRTHINENGTLWLSRYFFIPLFQDISTSDLHTTMESQVIYHNKPKLQRTSRSF